MTTKNHDATPERSASDYPTPPRGENAAPGDFCIIRNTDSGSPGETADESRNAHKIQ